MPRSVARQAATPRGIVARLAKRLKLTVRRREPKGHIHPPSDRGSISPRVVYWSNEAKGLDGDETSIVDVGLMSLHL